MAALLVSLILMLSLSGSKKAVTREDESIATASDDPAKSGVDKSSVEEARMDSTPSIRQSDSARMTGFVLQEDGYFEVG